LDSIRFQSPSTIKAAREQQSIALGDRQIERVKPARVTREVMDARAFLRDR
jgi:hypothetical protein